MAYAINIIVPISMLVDILNVWRTHTKSDLSDQHGQYDDNKKAATDAMCCSVFILVMFVDILTFPKDE